MAESNSGGASRVFMFAAILLGVLAMVMAFAYIQNAANVDNVPTLDVIVAAQDLPADAPLNPDTDFKIIKYLAPKDPAQRALEASRMLNPQTPALYRGQRVNRFIPAGQPINNADIGGQSSELTLTGDQRAMSISVRGANGLAGLVIPGDYVTLLVTRPRGGAPADGTGTDSSHWETVRILPAGTPPLKVIAVGNRTDVARSQVTNANRFASSGNSEAQQTIALAVTEDQAIAIQAMCGASQLPVTLLLTPHSSEQSPSMTPTPTPPAPARPRAGGT